MDEKTLELRSLYGWEGYGIYWAIIETLRDQDGYAFSLSKLGGLAVALGKEREWTEKFVADCIALCLFKSDGEVFYSQSLRERMKDWDSMRERNSKAAGKSWESRRNADAMQVHSECIADAKPIRLDKIKEDKSKEKEALSLSLFSAFYAAYPRKKSPKDAEKAWKALKPSDELYAEIIAALADQKRERETKVKYGLFNPEWKYPASWLRAEAWKDETQTDEQIRQGAAAGKNGQPKQPMYNKL